MAQQDEIQILLDELDTRLDRLRALYEQYFVGIEKTEPHVQKKDVDRRFQALRKMQLRNTAARFRFQALTQKYTTYLTYWQRITRQIEEGTYKRDLARQQRYGRGAPKDEMTDGPETEMSDEVSLEDAGDDMSEIVAEAERAVAAKAEPAPVRERMVEEVELPPDLGVDSAMPAAAASVRPTTSTQPAQPAKPAGAPAVRRAGLSMFGAAPGAKTVAAGSKPAAPVKPPGTMKPLAVTPPANPPAASSAPKPTAVAPATPPSVAPAKAPSAPPAKAPSAPPATAPSARPMSAGPGIPAVRATSVGLGPPSARPVAGPGIPARPLTPPPRAAGPGIPARPMTPPPSVAPAGPGIPARPLTPPPRGAGPGIPVRPMTPPPSSVAPAGPGIPARPLTPPPGRPAGPGIPARPLTPPPVRPAVNPPAAAQPRTAPSGGEDRGIRDLYERYAQSRKQTGETDVSFDTVAKQVRDTLPKLAEKYPGADVSFDVSIKDGRTVLKPVVRKK